MLLTVRLSNTRYLTDILGENDRLEEFWFGRGFAWAEAKGNQGFLQISTLVDVPRIVARTKRRDKEARFAVSYCDSYRYTAWGLKAVFLARLRPTVWRHDAEIRDVELVSYPERPHSAEIAQRILAPVGCEVQIHDGRLRLTGLSSLGDLFRRLPTLLLALDRRTRLFLSPEELAEIESPKARWLASHPAERALRLALEGRAAPLRAVLGPGFRTEKREGEVETDAHLFSGNEPISTALVPKVSIDPSQREFARKSFSKVNIDHNWLIYLPAAVASIQRANDDGTLERPESALGYFRDESIGTAIVQEKHMGSRGIVVICRTLAIARERFSSNGEMPGCVYTRNGRRFFPDEDTQAVFLERLERVLERSGFWRRFQSDWACFDGEVLPWSVKASEFSEESDLVVSGKLALNETLQALDQSERSDLRDYWKALVQAEAAALQSYDSMFKKYRTEQSDLAALKFAPFHLLAVEGKTFFDRSHLWHMQVLGRLARSGNGFLIPTRYQVTDTKESATWKKTFDWWDEISASGAEGLVVKPLPFTPRGRRGLAQPALKCRSREHLQLVYGPRYDSGETRELLLSRYSLERRRNKHRRILRQFALSIEAVTRFVQRSPMSVVHECVLGVLAQEVAPRHEHVI